MPGSDPLWGLTPPRTLCYASQMIPLPPLPPLLRDAALLPLRLLPTALQSQVLAIAVNRALSDSDTKQRFAFLDGRVVEVSVPDAGCTWRLKVGGGTVEAAAADATPDVTIRASLGDFAALAARRVDPDTLFFQRRLVMLGDTDLGLEVKNALDAVDPGTLPAWARTIAETAADLLEAPAAAGLRSGATVLAVKRDVGRG